LGEILGAYFKAKFLLQLADGGGKIILALIQVSRARRTPQSGCGVLSR
jgi:hypothetical protein